MSESMKSQSLRLSKILESALDECRPLQNSTMWEIQELLAKTANILEGDKEQWEIILDHISNGLKDLGLRVIHDSLLWRALKKASTEAMDLLNAEVGKEKVTTEMIIIVADGVIAQMRNEFSAIINDSGIKT